jgi:hypothetical protein
MPPKTVIKLADLKPEEVPADLRYETYFDFKAHPFEHQKLFETTNSVPRAIAAIHDYAVAWLAATVAKRRASAKSFRNEVPHNAAAVKQGHFEVLLEEGAVFAPAAVIGSAKADAAPVIYLAKGARVIGSCLYVDKGGIFLGENAMVEPSAGLKGPAIIGDRTEIRQGAYLRGDIIIGKDGAIRGEIKNTVLMDCANFPHLSYHGDSVCGYHSHFAGGMGTANLSIFSGILENNAKRPNMTIACEGKVYDIGGTKMGACVGDFCQCGGNGRTDPGTFLKPYTVVYMLSRVSKGFYGPCVVLKNKPLEKGIIEQAPFDPARLPS